MGKIVTKNFQQLRKVLLGMMCISSLGVYATAPDGITDAIIQSAQQKKTVAVKGTVSDAAGPVIGATVMEKGVTNGTVTDINGNFTINVTSANAKLIISSIGYVQQEVKADGSQELKITMAEDNQSLNEVVVVGYGTQKKVNLTGSVASMDVAGEMKSRTVTNLSNTLSGMMAGVTALQSTGAPGSDGATIHIRGLGTLNNSAPLILIDGVEGSMDAVNAQDVESISVLKDAASSAIYGSRAANGVVLVTTKKGNKGKVNVTYSGHISFLNPAKKYNFVTNYADYMDLMNEAQDISGYSHLYSDETIATWREKTADPNGTTDSGIPNYVAYPNTDWEDYLFGTGTLQEHNLQVSGGSHNSRYLVSAGYQNNPGIVKRTGSTTYNIRANIESDVTKWLTVGANTFASERQNDPSNFSAANTYLMATTPGCYPKYNGVYGGSAADEENKQDNNLAWYLERGRGHNRISRFNTTLFSTVTFMKGLSWDFKFNYTRLFQERRTWDDGTQYKENFRTGKIVGSQTDLANMSVGTYNYGTRSYTIQNLIHYDRDFGAHSISALAGYEEYKYNSDYVSTSKKGLIDYTLTVPSAASEMVSITGTDYDTATRSYFGRVNYSYLERYLFEANIRADGSSRFSKDSRWGYFPSFSAGWRISEENFMKPTRSWLDNLKIRASWGKLGNSNIGEYLYQSTYSSRNYSLNNVITNGLAVTALANNDLKWEETAVTNFGLDATLLNNRLNMTLDLYDKKTTGILYQPSIYMTVGTKSAPYKNIAEVSNKGVEFTASWHDNIGGFNYMVSGNISYNNNKVTKYKGALETGWTTNDDGTKTYHTNIGDVSTGGTSRVIEGKIINEYYLLTPYGGNGSYYNSDGSLNINGGPKDGMIRTEEDMTWLKAMIAAGYKFMPDQTVSKTGIWYGDYIYADNNGDGIYGNSYDYKFQKKSNRPPVFYGFNFSVSYKNFDLSGVFSGTLGSKLYWAPQVAFSTATRWGYEISKDIADNHYFYDPDNPTDTRTNVNSKYGRLMGESGYQNNAASTVYLYDANYLKLKNLTLGYTLPKLWASKVYAESIRLYVNAENLFTITDYPGMDPELGAGMTYMIARSFSVGANITF
jgi:TonB-linked SusC/RagA family outer membrane protein